MTAFSVNPGAANVAPSMSGTDIPVASLVNQLAAVLRDAPMPVIQAAYLRSAREFMRRSRWHRETIYAALQVLTPSPTFDPSIYAITSPDTNLEVIDIDAFSFLQPASVTSTNPGGFYQPVGPCDPGSFSSGTQPSAPMRYAYIPESQFQIWPLPDQPYPLKIGLVLQTTTTATTIPLAMVIKWNRFIEAGALSYLYGLAGEKWSDPNQALFQMGVFEEGVGTARADKARGYTRGSRRAQGRVFVTSARGNW